MEAIINNNNYQLTKTLIETKINYEGLSQSSKDTFVTLYNSLTPENAQNIYTQVTTLYDKDVFNMKWQLSVSMWKYSSAGFLISGIINLGAYVGLQYYPNNNILKNTYKVSAIWLLICVSIFMGAGVG